MQPNKRAKLNKILIVITIILVVITIICAISYIIIKNKKTEESYEDRVIAKNYFMEMTIDLHKKEAKRDGNQINLKDEFDITEEQQNLILSSETELLNFFADSTFEVNIKEGVAYITNKYQTKKLLVEISEESTPNFHAENVDEVQKGIYILSYDTQKKARAAYENLSTSNNIKNIDIDTVSKITSVNDVSQTVYGSNESNENNQYKSLGVTKMGLDNYQKIIEENGNPSDVIISTIGYGACIDNDYFVGKIDENYYNFIEDSKNVKETVPQGSRILEVIKESTTHNVKILPLVVVNNENYTTTSAIVKAIQYAITNSDVICYELANNENTIIDLMLKKAFTENKPVCCATISNKDLNGDYPANNSTTIAISSIDKSGNFADYSGKGSYVDFSAYSTDVEEIFNKTSTISKWSGAQYSNAHIASAIALIKTYHKQYTILEIYNELRNWCNDLGDEGKDELYGYGVPDFSKIQISDIDNDMPEIQEIVYENNTWEKSKNIQIKANDNIRIFGWTVTNSDKEPGKWNHVETLTPTLDVSSTIEKNGTYYIWVTDSAGNVVNKTIEVNKIDNTPPSIDYTIDDSKLESDKYLTIKINAKDDESGLNQSPYSFDSTIWGTTKELKVTENGTYKIYVKDNLDNIAQKEIKINKFNQEGSATIGTGSIIKNIEVPADWSGNINNSVKIIFNDNLKIRNYKITETGELPAEFIEYEDETQKNQNTVYDVFNNQGYTNFTVTISLTANTQYYLWVKDEDGNIMSQAFNINKPEF